MLRCDSCGHDFEGDPVWTNCCKLCPTCAEAPKHRYYYLNRPPGTGCQPPGFSNRESWFPMQNIPGTEWYAYGWVEYVRQPGFYSIWQYELRPADPDELEKYWAWRDESGL